MQSLKFTYIKLIVYNTGRIKSFRFEKKEILFFLFRKKKTKRTLTDSF